MKKNKIIKEQNRKENNTIFVPLKKYGKSAKIASFYGFTAINSPNLTNSILETAKKANLDPEWGAAEKIAILSQFTEGIKTNSAPQPSMFWMKRPFKGSGEKIKPNKIECELVILGVNKSITEMILLQTAKSILEEAGYKNLVVHINSLGSKDCVSEYEKKANSYIRKKINFFPSELKQATKTDPFFVIKNRSEKWLQFSNEAPQSIDYLNEQSRIYFKEILEFMETIEFPFIVKPNLLGDINYSTEIVFEIVENDRNMDILARGSRWNRLSKILEYKKEIAAASIHIKAKTNKPEKESGVKIVDPKFFLVQFGPEAKNKSFLVLEELRKAGEKVIHSLTKDKLISQMSAAEQTKAPYLILIGQKEALENNVIVRNIANRAQKIVPIKELGEYVKKIK